MRNVLKATVLALLVCFGAAAGGADAKPQPPERLAAALTITPPLENATRIKIVQPTFRRNDVKFEPVPEHYPGATFKEETLALQYSPAYRTARIPPSQSAQIELGRETKLAMRVETHAVDESQVEWIEVPAMYRDITIKVIDVDGDSSQEVIPARTGTLGANEIASEARLEQMTEDVPGRAQLWIPGDWDSAEAKSLLRSGEMKAFLENFGENLPVSVVCSAPIEDDDIALISSVFRNLDVLHIANGRALTDAALEYLVQNSPSLRYVSFREMGGGVTPEGREKIEEFVRWNAALYFAKQSNPSLNSVDFQRMGGELPPEAKATIEEFSLVEKRAVHFSFIWQDAEEEE